MLNRNNLPLAVLDELESLVYFTATDRNGDQMET